MAGKLRNKQKLTLVKVRQSRTAPASTADFARLRTGISRLGCPIREFHLWFLYSEPPDAFIEVLETAAKRAEHSLVYFAPYRAVGYPGAIVKAAEILSQTENSVLVSTPAVVSGEAGSTDAVSIRPAGLPSMRELREPSAFLASSLWRTSGLRELVAALRDERFLTREELAEWLWVQFYASRHLIPAVVLPSPLAAYNPLQPAKSLELRAEQVLAQKKWKTALDLLEEAEERRIELPKLELKLATTKCNLGRYLEARRHLQEHLHKCPDDVQGRQLQLEVQQKCANKPAFDDVLPTIESIPGWLTPNQARYLFELVSALPNDAEILEIGAHQGRSTIVMALASLGTARRITTVDPWDGGGRRSFRNAFDYNIQRVGVEEYVNPLQGLSEEVISRFPLTPQYDMVFIDGAHDFENVATDFKLVYPRTKLTGTIAFHDVSPAFPDVWRFWHQTAAPLLSNSSCYQALASGVKISSAEVIVKDEYFPFGAKFLDYLQSWRQLPQSLCQAYAETVSPTGSNELLKAAEKEISESPWFVKQMLRQAISNPLGRSIVEDPLAWYWNALFSIAKGNRYRARRELEKALSLKAPQHVERLYTRTFGTRPSDPDKSGCSEPTV